MNLSILIEGIGRLKKQQRMVNYKKFRGVDEDVMRKLQKVGERKKKVYAVSTFI